MNKCTKNFLGTMLCVISSILLFNKTLNAQQNPNGLQEVQEIVAIVNDKVISLYDLQQRIKLIALSGGSRTISGEELEYLRGQAMQGLIDDRLKIEEAEKYEADLPESDVIASYENYAQQFQMEPDEFEKVLKSAGVDKDTLLAQIMGSMAWQSVVGGLLTQQVNVTDDEVNNVIDKMERDKGKDEYKVSELFLLTTDNSLREQDLATAKAIYQQLSDGAQFEIAAQQFSQSSTAAVGGDMGWILENELPREVTDVVVAMEIGEVSEPIVTEDGVYIMKVTDKRKILTLDDNDILLTLNHMFFDTNEAFSEDELLNKNTAVLSIYEDKNACEIGEKEAEIIGAAVAGALGKFEVGNLPNEIRKELLSLGTGEGTQLYREPNGYRSFIVCEREIPEIKLPEFDVVQDNLQESRIQLIARRHLRDLRRDAIVDYR